MQAAEEIFVAGVGFKRRATGNRCCPPSLMSSRRRRRAAPGRACGSALGHRCAKGALRGSHARFFCVCASALARGDARCCFSCARRASVIYIADDGERLRSYADVDKYLQKVGLAASPDCLDLFNFDLSVPTRSPAGKPGEDKGNYEALSVNETPVKDEVLPKCISSQKAAATKGKSSQKVIISRQLAICSY